MAVIDSDAHVVETERTCEYMVDGEADTRPELVALWTLREDGKIDSATADQILDRNAKTRYGM